jgi:hypothetical protein
MRNEKAILVLVGGLPGTGKTYFSKRFATAIGARYISTDLTRKEMFSQRSYGSEEKKQVYEAMLTQMQAALQNKQHMVVDATFYRKELRKRFIDAAKSLKVEPVFIFTTASDETIKERLSRPREDSEADYEVFLKIRSIFESPEEAHLLLHTDQQPIEESIAIAQEYLKEVAG